MAKVFVSHRGQDSYAAEKLASELARDGHKVWLDVWQINIGDSIIERINDGLAEASYVVVCYSDAKDAAPWMNREWMAALARQLDGAGVRLLPARLTGGVPPAILADIKYADLVADWAVGVAALRRALK